MIRKRMERKRDMNAKIIREGENLEKKTLEKRERVPKSEKGGDREKKRKRKIQKIKERDRKGEKRK